MSILVLLAVIAVGLLTLSTVVVRTSSLGAAQAEARANARLALVLAIGDLQKSMGPDQRISANGSILGGSDVINPHWTGVWNSWRAGDDSSEGPDGASEHSTIGAPRGGMHPTYEEQRNDHFRAWLVSVNEEEANSVTLPKDFDLEGTAMPENDARAVRLVGEGSLGGNGLESDYVSARLLNLKTRGTTAVNGRYGWWIGDESQKARIMSDGHDAIESPTLAQKLSRHQAAGSTGTTSVEGLEGLGDETQLDGLTSLLSLDLVDGVVDRPSEKYHQITPFSRQVLADVREGGLKRDLSALLERPIRDSGGSGQPMETSDDFMLYKFSTKDGWMSGPDNQEAVPIHDLTAFYQLYDNGRSDRKEGVLYGSNVLSGLQVMAPDFGNKPDVAAYQRNYTTLYRQPVPVKVQFLLSLFAEEITPRPRPTRENPEPDTHEMLVGVTPSVTLWNPTNMTMTMRFGDPDRYSQTMRMMNLPIQLQWIKNEGEFTSQKKNLFWYASGADGGKSHIFNLYFSGKRQIKFGPGEVKAFSLPWSGDVSNVKQDGGYNGHWRRWSSELFFKTDKYFEGLEVVEGWEPQSFMFYNRSAPGGPPHVLNNRLTFKEDDEISFKLTADNTRLNNGNGEWIMFYFNQSNHQDYAGGGTWERRNYQITGRSGGGAAHQDFNSRIFTKGFKDNSGIITAAPRTGGNLIRRAQNEEGWPFLQFSFMAGTETNQNANAGAAGGRRFASRPFLHSTSIAASALEGDDANSLYNYGWNWWIEEINDIFEAPVQVSENNQGFYGGGYTPESGSTHIVQQEVPVVPPMSIAAFSHAHLGGFSIAKDSVYFGYRGAQNPGAQRVTATGQAGLFPHTLQAIGNSYAHPNIPADKAWVDWSRTFKTDEGAKTVTLADHSYLANKALWDEFFLSSMSPQSNKVKVFGNSANRSAEEVAEEFFFGDKALPNPRMVPYTKHLDETELSSLFRDASKYNDGLGDKIASHLMVEGPFNVNSTSVEAWKVFLSSLKGKKVSYLDKDKALSGGRLDFSEAETTGTPVSSFSLPNAEPILGSTNDPSEPEQWMSWRELSDQEIDELAQGMVEQVKLRGPFLSLSEFVNRRLDSSDRELSVKGAMQAALDDPNVSINEGFRSGARTFSRGERNSMRPAFPEAMEGPVAYGSSAYVDQADILRNFASQLTPRGDTFVIRAYGDSLDGNGNVLARAWCEAVIQRIPEYLDLKDEAHLKTSELSSESNKRFGRRLTLVSFRFLAPSEI